MGAACVILKLVMLTYCTVLVDCGRQIVGISDAVKVDNLAVQSVKVTPASL